MGEVRGERKVKFAIISFAHVHVNRYLPAILENPKAELMAIVGVGSNSELARAKAEELGVSYYDRVEDMLEKEKPEAVYIASEPYLHKEIISLLAPEGIAMLCDKPLATDIEDAEEIREIIKKHKVHFMMPFNPRFQKPVMKAREMIERGELGEIVSLYTVKVGKNPAWIKGMDTSWFLQKEKAGFGGFGDIGIHAVDGIRYLTRSEVAKVRAYISSKVHGLGVDDFGFALMEMESGALVTLLSGWFNPKGFPTWLDVRFEILGDRGALIIEKPYHDYWLYTNEGAYRKDWWRIDVSLALDTFVTSYLRGEEPPITIDDAFENFKVMWYAYLSSVENREIRLR